MNDESMKIYDEKGMEIATVLLDSSGAARLVPILGILTDVYENVSMVFFGAGDTKAKDYFKKLGDLCAARGYKFENDKDIAARISNTVEFIYESNVIEAVNEIDRNVISGRYKKGLQIGCVGAWLLSEQRGRNKLPLTGSDVIEMHRLLTDEQKLFGHHLNERFIGKVRSDNELVTVGGRCIMPPTAGQYDKFFNDLNDGLTKLKPDDIVGILRYNAYMHLKYELMHPFCDGNGRTGRNIVNYVLVYFGLPPLVFTSADKSKYYNGFAADSPSDSGFMEGYFLEKYREQHPELFVKQSQ